MNIRQILKIGISLLVICAAVAGILAAVNALTADRIAAYNQEKCREAIASIFPSLSDYEDLGNPDGVKNVNTVYRVTDAGGETVGWCVDVSDPKGYGGAVNVIVGIGEDGTLSGVSLLKHSETKGLTDPTAAGALFDRMVDAGGTAVDNIAGATYSSKAVKSCVNTALSLNLGKEAAK